MRFRFIVILVLLVVVPTAILALVAGKAMRNIEEDLHGGMIKAAENSIDLLDQQVTAYLETISDTVRTDMSDCLSRGSRTEFGKRAEPETKEIEDAARSLTDKSPAVDQVYIFMNPWGFLFPQEENKLAVPGSELGQLMTTLRRETASAKSLTGMMLFSHNGQQYCFSLLRDQQGIYAGFKINPVGLRNFINDAMSPMSGKGYSLIQRDVGIADSALVITDSLSGETTEEVDSPSREVLAKGKLGEPFDYIEVVAILDDPRGVMRASLHRARLFRWGIGLLALAVISGVGLVLYETASQVSQAHERSDFMMGVSHDLRTPISSIRMLSESILIGNIKDEDKKQKFLSTIVSECENLADMVEGVLFFMKQEHGASIYTFLPVSPATLVRSAVESFERRSNEKVDIELNIASDLSDVIADEDAISKVLQNMLENALKYSVMPNSSARDKEEETRDKKSLVRIDVDVRNLEHKGKNWVQISVRDYGVGIEKSELRKVFKKFYRASLEMDGKVGGIGLGLALCRDIIRAHGGKISVESKLGKGSEFKIQLPVGS